MEMITDMEVIGTKKWVINFYYEQLEHFNKVGLGKYTRNHVKITPKLIECTKKRLKQLSTVYDANLTPQAIKLRRATRYRLNKEKLINVSTNGDGAVTTKGCKDIRTNGHERSKT